MVTLALDENTSQMWHLLKVVNNLKTEIIRGTSQGGMCLREFFLST